MLVTKASKKGKNKIFVTVGMRRRSDEASDGVVGDDEKWRDGRELSGGMKLPCCWVW